MMQQFVVDDLRPQLNHAYLMEQMKTPNLDALSRTGTVFTHCYCQQSVCSPSRNSFMTGRRPDRTKVWNFIDNFRHTTSGQKWHTIPSYFRDIGNYTSVYGAGKLFHPKNCGEPANDYPTSWTVDAFNSYYWVS